MTAVLSLENRLLDMSQVAALLGTYLHALATADENFNDDIQRSSYRACGALSEKLYADIAAVQAVLSVDVLSKDCPEVSHEEG